MKNLLFIALLITTCFNSKAQQINIPVDSTTNSVTYSKVIRVDSTSKKSLYERAREWFAKTYNNSNYMLKMDDKEAGKIVGKGSQPLSFTCMIASIPFHANYIISVIVKDNRYRYEISDIEVPDDSTMGFHSNLNDIVIQTKASHTKTKKDNGEYKSRFKGYVFETDRFLRGLITKLKTAMADKAASKKDDF